MALKLATIVDEDTAKTFWAMLLERNDARQKAALLGICQSLIDRVGGLPDQRSRDIVTETLTWARDNPDTIHVHLYSRQARNGHMPNMVAFANLLDGLERPESDGSVTFDASRMIVSPNSTRHLRLGTNSIRTPRQSRLNFSWARRTSCKRLSAAPSRSKPIPKAPAFRQSMSCFGSIFSLPRRRSFREVRAIVNYAFKHAYINDFSFEGASNAVDREFGGVLEGELTEEQETRARELMALSEQRRIASMEQYKQDGVVPFMRREMIEADETTIELEPVQLEVKSE